MQKTASLGTSRILRKVLESEEIILLSFSPLLLQKKWRQWQQPEHDAKQMIIIVITVTVTITVITVITAS